MTPLQISDELAQEIWGEAETRGLPVEDFLRSVIRRERTLADRRKIEQEQAWWLSLPLRVRKNITSLTSSAAGWGEGGWYSSTADKLRAGSD